VLGYITYDYIFDHITSCSLHILQDFLNSIFIIIWTVISLTKYLEVPGFLFKTFGIFNGNYVNEEPPVFQRF
jgi:hypothetical protein